MIITKTPFRMSFFGGGTDMEEYFKENEGAVLSTTFDKYCYINVRHLPKEKTVKVCNWSTSSVSLNNILKKVFLGIRSVCIYIKEKLMYGVNIQITPVNSIRGKFKVELQRRSKLQIGEFLMTAGPCYIKCTEGAKCIIGNNVFLNHNSSITCAKEINIGDNCNIANNAVIVDHDHKL